MTTIDPTTALGRLRLATADYNDPVILDDATITYVLTKNNSNEAAAIKECAAYILGALSQMTTERLDKLTFYGSERFNNYLKYLKEVINNTTSSLSTSVAGVYFGGVNKQDFIDNRHDQTVIHHEYPPKHIHDCDEHRTSDGNLF